MGFQSIVEGAIHSACQKRKGFTIEVEGRGQGRHSKQGMRMSKESVASGVMMLWQG